ncbi:hypothetical protein Pfo_017732 [Paulownia fortunei]|nr:hypothetical protein Pfo_017732 [Paulownia fortunei]
MVIGVNGAEENSRQLRRTPTICVCDREKSKNGNSRISESPAEAKKSRNQKHPESLKTPSFLNGICLLTSYLIFISSNLRQSCLQKTRKMLGLTRSPKLNMPMHRQYRVDCLTLP